MATDDIEWRTDFGRKQAVQQCVRLRCHGCGNETVVIEQYRSGDGWSPLLWFPKPGHLSDTTDVPDAIAGAFDEGARCISVEASNAAVAMFRNALAQIVQDKGSEDAKKAKTLNDAVKQMVVDRTLHDGFKKFADHVRTVGNAGAHQETWAEVPIEQAQELREFVKHLIDTLYVQPGRLDRAIPPKKRSTQPAPSSP
ncbi:DUF4145 domain-containing protein [Gordonia sp. X0973]|nr:DUF4145 domain-containing protein [Gordonia sp. X0973]